MHATKINHKTLKKRILRILILSIFTTLLPFSCVRFDKEPDANFELRDFVWKGLNAYYLYQDEITDLSDGRFNSDQELQRYLGGFEYPEDLFYSLLKPSDAESKISDDYSIPEVTSNPRTTFTNGMEFGIFEDPRRVEHVLGYVSHILPLSYASKQTIARGDFFYAVIDQENDTLHLKMDNYLDLVVNHEQDTLKLLLAEFDGDTLIVRNERIDLVKKAYEYPTIFLDKVFDVDGLKIGYLMFNNDFSNSYIDDLNTVMLNFKNQSVNTLILDLRYNIGGNASLQNIAEIATMLTGQFPNETLINENWNIKAQKWFSQYQPDSISTVFPKKLQNQTLINSLHLTDLYIILDGDGFTGTSASELLINSLRPYINVHVFGNTTKGNHLGFIRLYDSSDYDFYKVNPSHFYALEPAVLSFANATHESFDTGILPTIQLCPLEDPLHLGTLGEITESILNKTLSYISNGNTGSNPTCSQLEIEILYNSINSKRMTDARVFIKRNLPNLGR